MQQRKFFLSARQKSVEEDAAKKVLLINMLLSEHCAHSLPFNMIRSPDEQPSYR